MKLHVLTTVQLLLLLLLLVLVLGIGPIGFSPTALIFSMPSLGLFFRGSSSEHDISSGVDSRQ